MTPLKDNKHSRRIRAYLAAALNQKRRFALSSATLSQQQQQQQSSRFVYQQEGLYILNATIGHSTVYRLFLESIAMGHFRYTDVNVTVECTPRWIASNQLLLPILILFSSPLID